MPAKSKQSEVDLFSSSHFDITVQNSNTSLTYGFDLQTNHTDNAVPPIQSNSNVSTSGISMNLDNKFYTVGDTVGIKGSVKNLIEGNNEIITDLHDLKKYPIEPKFSPIRWTYLFNMINEANNLQIRSTKEYELRLYVN